MKPYHLRHFWGALLLLLYCCTAHAIPIDGPAVVCKNNIGAYNTPSPTAGISYKWTMTSPLGSISTIYGPATSVLWTLPGTTTLKIEGFNTANVLIESGTKLITVKPLPQPLLTSNFQVACQNFQNDTTKGEGHPGSQEPGPLFMNDGPCPKVCENSWVTYTATGLPGSTFIWTVSGGTPSATSGNSIAVNWGAIGMASITVTEITADSCTGTRGGCIEIIGRPHAKFNAMPDNGADEITVCLKTDVIFVDHSFITGSSPIVDWYWDFGDGNTYASSTTANPVHAYANQGDYTVMLVVKNQCNCRDTAYLKVHVMDEEGVRITCPSVVCEKGKTNYTLADAVNLGCNDYGWSVVGGHIVSSMPYGPTIDVVWDNVDDDGFGYVLFDATKCDKVKCPGITTVKIPVIKQKGVIVGEHIVCEDKQYKYKLPAWPGTVYNWQILGGTPSYLSHTDQPNEIVVHVVGSGGFLLHCDYTNNLAGCGGKADLPLTVMPADVITGDKVVCQSNAASTNAYSMGSGSIADWTLTAPGGAVTNFSGVPSVNPIFDQPGTYSLSAKGSFCPPDALLITVLGTPVAVDSISGPDTICVTNQNIPYEFTAWTSNPGTTFDWQITGGTAQGSTSGKKITVVFSGSGPYRVHVRRMLTEEPYCAGQYLTKDLYTPKITVAISGKDTVCPNSVEAYHANYSGADAYEWTISSPSGNVGSIANNQDENVSVTWNNQTTAVLATLHLKVTKCGKDSIQDFNVVVLPSPIMSIGPDTVSVCSGEVLTVTLTSSPSINTGSLTWSTNGALLPTSVTLPGIMYNNYVFTNNASGDIGRDIRLTVTNPNGCVSTTELTKHVLVKPAPIALVTPLGPIVHCGFPFPTDYLTATIQGGIGGTGLLQWNGTTISTNPFPANNYGNYYVKVIGTNGCSSISNSVSIVESCGPNPNCTVTPAPAFNVVTKEHCGKVDIDVEYSGTNFLTGSTVSFHAPTIATAVSSTNGLPGSSLTPATGTATFNGAGQYGFSFDFTYLDVNGNPCVQKVNTSAIVPLIPDLLYELKCVNGSGYTLKMYDHSNFYPGTALTNYTFRINGNVVQSGTSDSWTSMAGYLPGTYTLDLTVTYNLGGHIDSCNITRMITIDDLPVADFLFTPDYACVGQKVIEFVNTGSGGTAYWDFDDGSTILMNDPNKIYQTVKPGGWNVVLTISNSFGCSSSKTKKVNSSPNNLKGFITATPPVICEGSTATLLYNPAGGSGDVPSNYAWMSGQDELFTTTTGSLPVSESGLYWIHAYDGNGCFKNTDATTVTVIATPDATITGDSLQCAGNEYTLNGYAGSDPGVTYQWMLNGGTIPGAAGTGPTLTQNPGAPGVYYYQLIVTVTQGSTVCTKTSAIFTVVVNAPPAPPVIDFHVLDCDAYAVELTANPNNPGTYNWSNGSTGNPVIVNTGGPYKVWYTDDFGCSVSAEAVVPKDPKGYLWIFPTGCYTKCPPVTIPGPIIPFTQWAWYHPGGSIINSGSGYVTPLTITAAGQYGMFLFDGYCKANIDTLNLSVPDNCSSVKCDFLKGGADFYIEGQCYYFYGWFNLSNTYGSALPYTISASSGTMGISGGTLPAGSSSLYNYWYPPTGFTSGIVTFTITVTLPNKTTCSVTIQKYLACPGYRSAAGGTRSNASGSATADITKLTAIPNPATNATVIAYRFAGDREETVRAVEVYDMTGRKMAAYAAPDDHGTWKLPLDGFASGVYQVVMKQGTRIVETARLSVTH